MKEYECVQVKNHKDVGKTIEEWQKNVCRLSGSFLLDFGEVG